MKHTAGPWVLVHEKDCFGNNAIHSVRVKEFINNNLVGDYRGCIIADLRTSHGDRPHAYPEAEANARLIAQAPELLWLVESFIALYAADPCSAIRDMLVKKAQDTIDKLNLEATCEASSN